MIDMEVLIARDIYWEEPSNNLDGVYWMIRNYPMPDLFSSLSAEAKVSSLEADDVSFKQKNELLIAKIAELWSQLSCLPNK